MYIMACCASLTNAAPPREYVRDLSAPHNDDEEARHENPELRTV